MVRRRAWADERPLNRWLFAESRAPVSWTATKLYQVPANDDGRTNEVSPRFNDSWFAFLTFCGEEVVIVCVVDAESAIIAKPEKEPRSAVSWALTTYVKKRAADSADRLLTRRDSKCTVQGCFHPRQMRHRSLSQVANAC